MSDTGQIRFRAATEEAPATRWTLIGLAFAGLAILVFAPLIAVFVEALADGAVEAVRSLASPDARDAIRLTLTIAAISVPLNALFGVAAAWFITKFDFRGKAFLITLIDLPFSVSPVVAGLCIVLMFGANSAVGGWLVAQGYPIVFAMPGIILATMFVTFPFVARELIPVMIEQGRAEEEAALALAVEQGAAHEAEARGRLEAREAAMAIAEAALGTAQAQMAERTARTAARERLKADLLEG
jgi:sulfate transport system permease protein